MMKLKFTSEEKVNDLTPIIPKTSKVSKWKNTIILGLLTIILLAVAQSSIIQNLKTDSKRKMYTDSDYPTNNYCSVVSDDYKFDCFPRGKADQKSCEERNCCWSPSTPNSKIPWCYYPSNYSNYKVINVTKFPNEIVAFFNLTLNTNYKDDIKILCMDISIHKAQRLRVKVINHNHSLKCPGIKYFY